MAITRRTRRCGENAGSAARRQRSRSPGKASTFFGAGSHGKTCRIWREYIDIHRYWMVFFWGVSIQTDTRFFRFFPLKWMKSIQDLSLFWRPRGRFHHWWSTGCGFNVRRKGLGWKNLLTVIGYIVYPEWLATSGWTEMNMCCCFHGLIAKMCGKS